MGEHERVIVAKIIYHNSIMVRRERVALSCVFVLHTVVADPQKERQALKPVFVALEFKTSYRHH